MDQFIARTNIEHYLGLLKDGYLAPEKRATVVKLLLAEENKLGHDREHLEFAECLAAKGRDLLNQLRNLYDWEDATARARGERQVAVFETNQRLLDDFCHRLRAKANSSRL